MTKSELVRRSADLINWIDAQIGEVSVRHNPRVITSAILCSLGRQHHRAIVRLVGSDLPASAAALLRVIFECYVRALWLQACATDAEVDEATNDNWPRMKLMVQAIENAPKLQSGVLVATFDSRWKAFNSFTHNGTVAFSRQIKDHVIGPRFSDEEIHDIVRFADSIALMIAGQMAVLTENVALAQTLLAKVRDYSNGG